MAVALKELIADAKKRVRALEPSQVKEQLEGGEIAVLLDVREPAEYARGHVPGAVNIPRGMLELKADADSPVADERLTANRDRNVVVYCLKAPGARSLFAADTLAQMGYEQVAAMPAGLNGWADAGFEVDAKPS
jgi:rhodanese-related sulfurtransferase